MIKEELNNELLKACTSNKVDFTYIEELLKLGANPLGCVDDHGDNNLYDVVLCHFLDKVIFEKTDDSDFLMITDLFIQYGMDISNPEIPYDDRNVLNPLWSFAFYDTDTALGALKLLLDNGLDVDSAGLCWGHDLTDLGLADFEIGEDVDCQSAVESFRKLMLFASYPHIINADEHLQREVWFRENNYDITKFRSWDNYEYLIEPTDGKRLNRSIVRIIEKKTQKEVWKFGFEISSNDVK